MKIEELIGRRNYERRLKENPSEYGYPTSFKTQRTKLSNLLQESINRKTNSYENNIIPIMYIDTNKKNKSGEDIIALTKKSKSNNDLPYTEYYRGALNKPLARTQTTVGHELGHAKYHIDMKELNSKLEEAEKKNKNSLIARILKMRKDKLEDNYSKNKEAIADKNISKYLKQMGLSKRDRQAHYYLRKSEPPKNEGRYKGKLGNLKYLKDYIFGFSFLPENYHFYKSMTPEWKDMMRDYFYGLFYLNFSEQGVEKYKEYLDDRIKGLKDWLIEQDPACFKEQKHLDEGSPERIYWHYGKLMTLIDLRKGLDNPHSKISQIGH